MDVPPTNDWSQARVSDPPANDLGQAHYPAFGFIHGGRLVAEAR